MLIKKNTPGTIRILKWNYISLTSQMFICWLMIMWGMWNFEGWLSRQNDNDDALLFLHNYSLHIGLFLILQNQLEKTEIV